MLNQKSSSSSPSLTNQQTMYPKVKVRALEQDDDYGCSGSPLQGFNFLSIRDSSPPVKGIKQYPSVCVAKVPKSYIPRSITPPPSLPKSVKKGELESDVNQQNIRASSIPRPRAVISSPDNDQILGSKKKSKVQRPSSTSKRHDLPQNRHLERRCTQTNTTLKRNDLAQSAQSEGRFTQANNAKKPLRRGEHEETAHVNDVTSKRGSAVDVRVPVTNITKAKPCFMRT